MIVSLLPRSLHRTSHSLWIPALFIFLLLLLLLNSSPVQAAPPGAFELVSPVNTQVVTAWQPFQPWVWEIADGAVGYDFKVERTAPDTLVIFDQVNWQGFCENGYCYNGFSADQLTNLTNGTYQWNVVARNGSETTPSTNGPWTFTINSTAVLPSAFGLHFPMDGMAFNFAADLTYFEWGLAGAATYSLFVQQTAPTSTDVLMLEGLTPAEDDDALACQADFGPCTYTLDASETALLIEDHAYRFTVRAYNPDGFIVPSGAFYHHFHIDAQAILPGPFQLWQPAYGQIFNSAADLGLFRWRRSENATYYHFFVDQNGQHWEQRNLTPDADTDALTCDYRECKFTPPADLLAALVEGQADWNIQAWSPDSVTGGGEWFVIDANAVLPGDFNLVNAPDGIVYVDETEFVKLDWNESTGAETYLVWVNRLEPTEEFAFFIADLTAAADSDTLTCANGRCTLTLDTTLHPTLSDGYYEWGIQSYNPVSFLPAANQPYHFTLSASATELLTNGDLEVDDNADKVPDGWKSTNLSLTDKLMCNKPEKSKFFAYQGTCAFRFVGGVNEMSKLLQKLDFTGVRAASYGELDLSLFAETKNATTGLSVIMKVIYDDTAYQPKKDTIEIPAGTALYTGVNVHIIPETTIAKIKLQIRFRNPTAGGKILIDHVSLMAQTAQRDNSNTLPLPESSGVIPLPAAPKPSMGKAH